MTGTSFFIDCREGNILLVADFSGVWFLCYVLKIFYMYKASEVPR